MELGYIPWRIKLRSDGGMSFQSTGPTAATSRCWNRELRAEVTSRSHRSAERIGREERVHRGKVYTLAHKDNFTQTLLGFSNQEQVFIRNMRHNWKPMQISDHVGRDVRVRCKDEQSSGLQNLTQIAQRTADGPLEAQLNANYNSQYVCSWTHEPSMV